MWYCYTFDYLFELHDWLNSIERKPDALRQSAQCTESKVAEKPRPSGASHHGLVAP